MSEDKTEKTTESTTYVSSKIMVIHIIILLVAIVLTATLTYALTSKQYLDKLDSQNQQIRTLQNAIRKSNGLPELDELQ